MKKIMLTLAVVSAISFTACSSDDDNSSEGAGEGEGNAVCISCVVQGAPTVEICEGENGNAFILDQDAGVNYADYVAALQATGATCN